MRWPADKQILQDILPGLLANSEMAKWSNPALHVHGGVVAKTLDAPEIKNRKIDLVLDDLVVGAFFGRQGFRFDQRQAVAEMDIEQALLLKSGLAQVIEPFVQPHTLMFVVAGGCS